MFDATPLKPSKSALSELLHPPRPPVIEMGEEEWAIQQESLKRLNRIALDGATQQSKVIGHQPYK